MFGPLLITIGTGIATLPYFQICETSGGRTVGRTATGIRLINVKPGADRTDRVRGWQAYGRRLVEAFGDLILCLGSLSMLWDPEKRTWGDRASGTAVIQSREAASPRRGVEAGGIATAVTAVIVVALVAVVAGNTDRGPNNSFSPYNPTNNTNNTNVCPGGSDCGTSNNGTTGNSGTRDNSGSVDPSQSTQVATDATVTSQAPDGVDSAGNTTSYRPENMRDNDPTTAWRTKGDATGQDITISLAGTKTITSLGLINGYAKTDPASGADRYHQERQITQVTWRLDDGTSFSQSLHDNEGIQSMNLKNPTSSANITLHIKATSNPGDPNYNYTAISKIEVEGQ